MLIISPTGDGYEENGVEKGAWYRLTYLSWACVNYVRVASRMTEIANEEVKF